MNGQLYRRDPDVFDTWFSSGQWPYVTLDYPDGDDFKKFYPLSLMNTAGEILYQWVARMIMLGLYATGEIPFKDVYIHGLVLAEGGAKMSKSLGNAVDLMEAISSYGSDALRMGLLVGRAPAVNRGYDQRRVEEARNFSNKLWNVARFVEDKVGDQHHQRLEPEAKSPADHWILSRLAGVEKTTSDYLNDYRLSEAYEAIYHFVWDDLADWYVEVSKAETNPGLLAFVFESTLKLVHPFGPFVSETIWQTLAWDEGTILATQAWPKVPEAEKSMAAQFKDVKTVIEGVRQMSSALGLKQPDLYFHDAPVIASHAELIKRLAKLGNIQEAEAKPAKGLRLSSANYSVWLDVEPAVAQNYLSQLQLRQKEQGMALQRLESRLASPDYEAKAPEELVAQTRRQIEQEKNQLDTISKELADFESHLK